MSLSVNQILHGQYRILQQLGQGGMGAVYLAEDLHSAGHRYAVKEHIPDPNADPQTLQQLRQQFRIEASTLANLNHPNLPKVSECFSDGGNEYIVMEYIEGDDLATLLQKHGRPVPEKPALIWADQVLDALEYLHGQQPNPIIHRDIKPANIILTSKGRVKLVDFGLVKLLDSGNPATATVIRGMGTPEYTPLEQYPGSGSHTDATSDLYSLGATLYHLLTGIKPPTVRDRLLDANRLSHPRQVNPGLSKECETLVMKAMEITPDRRYQTAAEMRSVVAAIRAPAQPPPPGPPPLPVSSGSTSSSSDAWAVIVGTVLVVFIGLFIWGIWSMNHAAPKSVAPAITSLPSTIAPRLVPAISGTIPIIATGHLAFASMLDGDLEVYTMSIKSSLTQLTANERADYAPAWSPKGERLAFVSNRASTVSEIFVMNADGTSPVRLTNNGAEDDHPVWSPDGARIAFHSDRDGSYDIFVMNADGTATVRLTNHAADDRYPTWSPDGTRIAFQSGRDGSNDIFVMKADGTAPVRLTNHSADDRYPAWSPDGSRIAFVSNRDGNWEIYAMNADGTNPVRLTDHPAEDLYPMWSPSGTELVFQSKRDGNSELYMMIANGTNVVRLTYDSADDATPVWSR